ncbi:MAG: FHA domain-containing protein [Candidatus Solibacter sp.]|nr:FHA domain-containing protein [Candidatus Solibacter sp.]
MELELTIESKDSGAVAVQRLPLSGRVVLGRGPESPVALEGPEISREHIAFEGHDGQLCVIDLSANGSWVNGQPLATGRRYLLTEADRVQVPGYEMRCTILPSPQAPVSTPAAAGGPVSPVLPAASPAKQFMSSVTGMEIVVLMLLLTAIVVAAVYFRL